MLVLQRRVGESIIIGDGIEVVVLDVSGGRTRLGFRCGNDVHVRRKELPLKASPEGSPEKTGGTERHSTALRERESASAARDGQLYPHRG